MDRIAKNNIQGMEVDYIKFTDLFNNKEAFLFRKLLPDLNYIDDDEDQDKTDNTDNNTRFKHQNSKNNQNGFKRTTRKDRHLEKFSNQNKYHKSHDAISNSIKHFKKTSKKQRKE